MNFRGTLTWGQCYGVETAASIVSCGSVRVRVSGGSSGLKNIRITERTQRFILVGPDWCPTSSNWWSLYARAPKIWGVTIECNGERERFGRGLLGTDPRDASSLVEPSPHQSGGRRRVRWRSSRCPSLGCSALGTEHELNGEGSNDLSWNRPTLSRIILPLLGSDLSLIYRGRSGTWQFGGVEPMVYMRRSLGGSCCSVMWTVAMLWSWRSSGHRPAALF
jgi:hypothetical protein